MAKISKLILILVVVFSTSLPALAQEKAEGESKSIGPRRQLATIIFAGLGGAVLGLSTLSFYGRPQDKLANIAVGFAIGLISGTIYSFVSVVDSPDDYYGHVEDPYFHEKLNFQAQAMNEPVISATLVDLSF